MLLIFFFISAFTLGVIKSLDFMPLMEASIESGDISRVRFLSWFADLDELDDEGVSYLAQSAIWERAAIAEYFLNQGASLNSEKDIFGGTPLTAAAWTGNYEMMEMFIKAGANPNIKKNDGLTPLMLSVVSNCAECVKLLIKADVNRDAKNSDGKTALEMAHVLGDGSDIEFDHEIISLLKD